MTPITTQTLENALTAKLMVSFGKTAAEATDGEMMRASALVLRDMMALREVETRQKARQQHARQVHYLSLEFLMGRSLMKNAYNLGLLPQLREALEHLGFKAADIFEIEPDAALGNGGLGRLAACYLDSMTTLGIPATGYSLCYELGIFKQRIVDGQQVELPDDWKAVGGAWLIAKPEEREEVRFGGKLREVWHDGHLHVVHEDYNTVIAIPCDMEIAGYGTDHVNTLRLWEARSPRTLDMALFFAIFLPFVMPKIHERYFFMADMLSILYAARRGDRRFVPLLVIGASLMSYMPILTRQRPVDERILGLMMLGALIAVSRDLLSAMRQNRRTLAKGGETP